MDGSKRIKAEELEGKKLWFLTAIPLFNESSSRSFEPIGVKKFVQLCIYSLVFVCAAVQETSSVRPTSLNRFSGWNQHYLERWMDR